MKQKEMLTYIDEKIKKLNSHVLKIEEAIKQKEEEIENSKKEIYYFDFAKHVKQRKIFNRICYIFSGLALSMAISGIIAFIFNMVLGYTFLIAGIFGTGFGGAFGLLESKHRHKIEDFNLQKQNIYDTTKKIEKLKELQSGKNEEIIKLKAIKEKITTTQIKTTKKAKAETIQNENEDENANTLN